MTLIRLAVQHSFPPHAHMDFFKGQNIHGRVGATNLVLNKGVEWECLSPLSCGLQKKQVLMGFLIIIKWQWLSPRGYHHIYFFGPQHTINTCSGGYKLPYIYRGHIKLVIIKDSMSRRLSRTWLTKGNRWGGVAFSAPYSTKTHNFSIWTFNMFEFLNKILGQRSSLHIHSVQNFTWRQHAI